MAINDVPANVDARVRLLRALRTERMFSLTGAGLSVYAGYRPWETFLNRLSDKVRQREGVFVNVDRLNATITNPAQRARRLVAFFGAGFEDYFRTEFGPSNRAPDAVLRSFASLPFRHHLTLNFDSSLRTTQALLGKEIESLTAAQSSDLISFLRNMDNPEYTTKILHLHGRYDDAINRIVLTEDGYASMYSKNPMRQSLLWTLFATRRVLFVGFGYADRDFLEALHLCCRQTSPQEELPHFAIVGLRPEQDDAVKRFDLSDNYQTDAIFYNVHLDTNGEPDHREFVDLITGLQADLGARPVEIYANPHEAEIAAPALAEERFDPEDIRASIDSTDRLIRSHGRMLP